jgi:hypothetical protein
MPYITIIIVFIMFIISAVVHYHYRQKRIIKWVLSGSGYASLTILSVMIGLDYDSAGVPCDIADFGRCVKLLRAMPEFRYRLPEVSQKYPRWKPFVEKWDYLEQLYSDYRPEARGKLYREIWRLAEIK